MAVLPATVKVAPGGSDMNLTSWDVPWTTQVQPERAARIRTPKALLNVLADMDIQIPRCDSDLPDDHDVGRRGDHFDTPIRQVIEVQCPFPNDRLVGRNLVEHKVFTLCPVSFVSCRIDCPVQLYRNVEKLIIPRTSKRKEIDGRRSGSS